MVKKAKHPTVVRLTKTLRTVKAKLIYARRWNGAPAADEIDEAIAFIAAQLRDCSRNVKLSDFEFVAAKGR